MTEERKKNSRKKYDCWDNCNSPSLQEIKEPLFPFISLCMPLQSAIQQRTQMLKSLDGISRAMHYPTFDQGTDKVTNGWWAGHMPQRSVVSMLESNSSVESTSEFWNYDLSATEQANYGSLAFQAARGEAKMHPLVTLELNCLHELGCQEIRDFTFPNSLLQRNLDTTLCDVALSLDYRAFVGRLHGQLISVNYSIRMGTRSVHGRGKRGKERKAEVRDLKFKRTVMKGQISGYF